MHRLFGAVSRRLVSFSCATALVGSVFVGPTLIGATPSYATLSGSTGCIAVNSGAFNTTLLYDAFYGSGVSTILPASGDLSFLAGEVISISINVTYTDPAGSAGLLLSNGVTTYVLVSSTGTGPLTNDVFTGGYTVTGSGDLSFFAEVGIGNGFGTGSIVTTVTCTPVATGSITIVKDTTGGDGTFGFTGDLGPFDLTTVAGTISRTFDDLTPGTFNVTETVSATHTLSGLVCDDPTSNTTISGPTATIDLAAGETVTCTYTNTEVSGRTAAIIADFIERRAGTLTEAGPALQHFLDRFSGNAENGFSSEILAYQQIPNGAGGAEFDAVMMDPGARWAFWLEGTFERYREGGPGTEINGGVAMLQGGFDVLLGDNLILGVTAVGDGARELSTDLGYFVEGLGWMAGPYGAVRLAEGVVFDAKFLWGQSWNDISPFLTYTDQFTTTRWLATARLAGEAAIGPLMFRPEIYVAYFSETQAEYVDNNGITIPEQTIALGRMTFGPEIAIPVRTSNGGTIEPRIAMEGVWDFIGTRPLSARVNGGIQFSGAGGASLLLSGGYGGLFAPSFSSWNVRANITVPLQ